MEKYMTYIWEMGRGTRLFRFQTTDPKIARKLNRTKGWLSVIKYCNKPLWIFQKRFYKPQDARKKLKSLTGVSKLEKGVDTGEFYAITYADKTPINEVVIEKKERKNE